MKELIQCAIDIGEQMLICGGEVHRAEDSVSRLCRAFGAVRADVFIIPSSMLVTAHFPNGESYTESRRITVLGTDFQKLDLLNGLSRKICAGHFSSEEIRAALEEITACPPYPAWAVCGAYCLISGAFTLFFGGTWLQALFALLMGGVIFFLQKGAMYVVHSPMFTKFLSSFVITAIAYALFHLHLIPSADQVIIGNIMLLIPGLGFTNALRDLFTGDSIAGILRIIEALLSAIAIACGYFLFAFLSGGILV